MRRPTAPVRARRPSSFAELETWIMEPNVFSQTMSAVSAVSLPVPDLAILLIAAVVVALVIRAAAKRQREAVAMVSNAYLAELTRANRQLNSAESKLSKLKSEVEKARRQARSGTARSRGA